MKTEEKLLKNLLQRTEGTVVEGSIEALGCIEKPSGLEALDLWCINLEDFSPEMPSSYKYGEAHD